MSDLKNVLLVDDHCILREGLTKLVEFGGEVIVSAAAATAEEGLSKVDSSIDLVIVDISLPDHDGTWLVKKIKAKNPTLPVLVLTMHSDTTTVLRALDSGADGYLTKDVQQPELLRAIRILIDGGSYIQDKVAPFVIGALRDKHKEPEPALSQRETEIIQLLVEGKGNAHIADHLCLSVSTIKANLRKLYNKLNVSGRTEAVAVAVQRGLVD